MPVEKTRWYDILRVLIMRRKDKRELKLEINEFIKLLDIFILDIRLSGENDKEE